MLEMRTEIRVPSAHAPTAGPVSPLAPAPLATDLLCSRQPPSPPPPPPAPPTSPTPPYSEPLLRVASGSFLRVPSGRAERRQAESQLERVEPRPPEAPAAATRAPHTAPRAPPPCAPRLERAPSPLRARPPKGRALRTAVWGAKPGSPSRLARAPQSDQWTPRQPIEPEPPKPLAKTSSPATENPTLQPYCVDGGEVKR